MTTTNHRIVRDFLAALGEGKPIEGMLTADMSGWTVMSGPVDKATYQAAAQLLAGLFKGKLMISIRSLTAEEDRVVAEISSDGTLLTGDVYHNDYLFLFRIRDGRIASVAEYFNPEIVRQKILPAMQAAMARASAETGSR